MSKIDWIMCDAKINHIETDPFIIKFEGLALVYMVPLLILLELKKSGLI